MSELVSIIMPSYNTAEFIAESIRSVQNQTYTNWELIIVDDCSSDNTDMVIESFSDQRIIYIKNDRNNGAAVSRNRALRAAKGKWIAFLDSDDLWFKEKLEKQINFMKKNDYHFSYTNYSEMNENGVQTGIIVSGPRHITKHGMYNFCWPGCLTVMYDREFVGEIQIVDIKKNNDYAMWLKVCKKTDCFLLDEILGTYRRGRQGSISSHSIKKMIAWHYRLFRYAENESIVFATAHTIKNLLFGFLKKVIYVKGN